jgi:hypothetical protein
LKIKVNEKVKKRSYARKNVENQQYMTLIVFACLHSNPGGGGTLWIAIFSKSQTIKEHGKRTDKHTDNI